MATDRKYGKITLENGSIGEDEPVFVFRAQDVHTPEVIKYYLQRCRDGGSPEHHLKLIEQGLYDVKRWQNTEGNTVKTPTSNWTRDDPAQPPTSSDNADQPLASAESTPANVEGEIVDLEKGDYGLGDM